VGEGLAGYLAVLGVTGSCADAQLAAGQFHDVVLIGEVAYRFPRDEESRRALPAGVRLLEALGQAGLPVPVPLSGGHVRSPLGRCHVPLTHLPGQPLGQIRGERAARAVVSQLASLLDRLAGLGADPAIAALVPAVSGLAAASFNANKLITARSGGVILTGDDHAAGRARYLINQVRDHPVEYRDGEPAWNYRMTNLHAAVGCAQLERASQPAHRRQAADLRPLRHRAGRAPRRPVPARSTLGHRSPLDDHYRHRPGGNRAHGRRGCGPGSPGTAFRPGRRGHRCT
jgi:hypothetical protein